MRISSEKKAELLEKLEDFFVRTEVGYTDAKVFRRLYRQFLEETHYIDWNSWKFISENVQCNYEDLPSLRGNRRDILDRLVIVKLNGGLGTTMGCQYPKSFIQVKGELSFLDIALQQHKVFNETHQCDVPLVLMNSFYTDEQTVQKLGENSNVLTFCQSKCPRIYADTLLPVEEDGSNEEWYPPGHGNIFESLSASGMLDDLLDQGRDIMFVSNIDNTGAILDLKIAQLLCDESVEYIMECTRKTEKDIKGGTLIDIDGKLMHLEIPQVPPEHLDEFCSTRTFKIFNTNNIWVDLYSAKERLEAMSSEIIVNKKTVKNRDVIQLETSIGGCIRNFSRAYCVHVDRARFLPVKNTDDLLAVSSDLYSFGADGSLQLTTSCPAPTIKLGKFFQSVENFHARFDECPNIRELRSLTIKGDIRFERDVTLKGNVEIINNSEQQHVITSRTSIENQQIVFN